MKIKLIPVVDAIIVRNNKILLGKRDTNKKSYPGDWSIPGGKVKPGEKLGKALKREVKEETGINVKIVKLLSVKELFHHGHYHIVFYFKAKPISGKIKAGSDLVEVKWVSLKDINKLKLKNDNKKYLNSIKKLLKKNDSRIYKQ
jgi:8-oxo-dGTP diphosphatase